MIITHYTDDDIVIQTRFENSKLLPILIEREGKVYRLDHIKYTDFGDIIINYERSLNDG